MADNRRLGIMRGAKELNELERERVVDAATDRGEGEWGWPENNPMPRA